MRISDWSSDVCSSDLLVRLGLQQDRVHVRMKFRTAGEGLQGLSPADLPAVRRHRRVVGHVLWLEGKDAKAAISKDPAKPGHKDGLAHIGTRAPDPYTDHISYPIHPPLLNALLCTLTESPHNIHRP